MFLPFGELIFLFLLSDGGEVKIKLVRVGGMRFNSSCQSSGAIAE